MDKSKIDLLYSNLDQYEKDLLHIVVFERSFFSGSHKQMEYSLWSGMLHNRSKFWRHDQFTSFHVKATLNTLSKMEVIDDKKRKIIEPMYAYLFSLIMKDSYFSENIVSAVGGLRISYSTTINELIRSSYYFLNLGNIENIGFYLQKIYENKKYHDEFINQKIGESWLNEEKTFRSLLLLGDSLLYPLLKETVFKKGLPENESFLRYENKFITDAFASTNSTVLSVLFEGCFFRGDIKGMEDYLNRISEKSWHKPAKTAWLKMVQGNHLEATLYFEQAIKLFHKEYKVKKNYFQDANAVFYHFCLFITKNTTKYIDILKYSDKIQRTNPLQLCFYIQALYCLCLQNQKESVIRIIQTIDTDTPLVYFTLLWTLAMMNEKPNNIALMDGELQKAEEEKNQWLLMELLALKANFLPEEEKYKSQSEKLSKSLNLFPLSFTNLGKEKEWEMVLNAIDMIFAPKTTVKTKTSRLAWVVNFESFSIQPKEQTLSKNGTWTAGKNIALKRLREEETPFMEPQDYSISKCIREYEESSGWGYYAKISLGWDYPMAFKQMVGHPLIFLESAPDVSVELVREEVQLLVIEKENQYEVTLSVEKLAESGITIIKETPTRYKLFVAQKEHFLFHQASHGKKLIVPKEGKEKLSKIVTNLSKVMTVQSDLGEENQTLPAIDADSRIYVHLLQMGEGFSLSMYCKPFGVIPPYFKPGNGGENVIAVLEGVRTRAKRNLKVELQNYKEVESQCPTLSQNSSGDGVWILEDTTECLDMLTELDLLLKAEKIVVEWPKGEKVKIKHRADFKNFSFNIQKKQDWFEVSGELKLDSGEVLGMQELLKLIDQSNSQYIPIAEGQFLALTKAFQKKLKEISGLVGEKGKKGLRIHPLAALAMDDFASQLTNIKTDKAWKEQIDRIKSSRKLKPELPKNFDAELRPYQTEGFIWLSQLAHWGVGACLADDMGLGKTVQALAVILARADQGPTLVVAPVSVCRNWEKEAFKFAPTLTSIIFTGSTENRKEILEQVGKYDLLICSYGLLQQEIELFKEKKYATIVLDEAQSIKNHQTKRAKAAFELQGDFKIITTGTPIENHLGELWSLFNFINPGFLGSIQDFQDRYAYPIEKLNNKERKQQLKKLISPFILRRKKNEVLDDLPEKTEITLTVQLSEQERAFYEALRLNALKNLEGAQAPASDIRFQILAEITRLRRACCNPRLVTKDVHIESAKLKLFEEVVDELLENGHKALVFSQYIEHLSILKELLDSKNISYQYLDGSTPPLKRQESVDAFQRGDGDLFLISLKAGGTGLNLTAADYVIHMDPWWNPAVEDQASDRTHRIGQKRPVTVYRLVTENTIEEKILALHHDKRDLADSLLEGTESSSRLSAEDLLNLLKR